MKLYKSASLYWNKIVHITMVDGDSLTGQVVSYTSAVDNDPDPESILIRIPSGMLIELFDYEVESIVLLNN